MTSATTGRILEEILEYLPVLTVPSRERLLLKDLQHVRIQSAKTFGGWRKLAHEEQFALDQYLMEAPDKKSWTVPNSPNRLGFNDTGVFLHQDHKKRYFGMVEVAAKHLVPNVETKEAIPLYFGRSDPMMEKLSEKVATISDEMRSKVILATFRAADTNKNGTLSKHEIGSLIRRLVATASTLEVEEMVKEADANRDGTIDYDEFTTWMMITQRGVMHKRVKEALRTPADIIRASFRAWDHDGNGLISKEEVRRVLRDACGLKAKDVDVLAQVMDTDDNGYIDYDEFCSFLYPQHWNAGAVQ